MCKGKIDCGMMNSSPLDVLTEYGNSPFKDSVVVSAKINFSPSCPVSGPVTVILPGSPVVVPVNSEDHVLAVSPPCTSALLSSRNTIPPAKVILAKSIIRSSEKLPVNTFLPTPPSMMSLPDPPSKLSLPPWFLTRVSMMVGWPTLLKVTLPLSPMRISLPEPPDRSSLPAPPIRTSLPVPPNSTSLPPSLSVVTCTSCGNPLTPKMISPLPPIRISSPELPMRVSSPSSPNRITPRPRPEASMTSLPALPCTTRSAPTAVASILTMMKSSPVPVMTKALPRKSPTPL